MDEPEDCVRCGQGYYLHIEILDKDCQLHLLCPTSIYEVRDKFRYMTKKERQREESK